MANRDADGDLDTEQLAHAPCPTARGRPARAVRRVNVGGIVLCRVCVLAGPCLC